MCVVNDMILNMFSLLFLFDGLDPFNQGHLRFIRIRL